MNEKQRQQETQPNSAAREGQRAVSRSESSRLQPEQRGPLAHRVYRCANCDIEFFWSPTVVQGRVYCCTGCAAGGPCNCDYSLYRSVTIMGIIHYEQ